MRSRPPSSTCATSSPARTTCSAPPWARSRRWCRSTCPPRREWPLEQKLQGERDTLGHYLSGHPTDPWKDELAQLSTCPLGEIVDRYQPPKPRKNDDGEANRFRRGPDTPWTVAGMVTAVRKRGDSDAFVRLEDGSGSIEVSFFGELYQQVAPLLTRDEMLIVEGGLRIDDFSGGGFQLRARARLHAGRCLPPASPACCG